MSEVVKVTRKQALERFIVERVQGERPTCANEEGNCVYSHDGPGGGCEIGQYLPGGVADWADERSLGVCDEELQAEMRAAGMEQPRSAFWATLQSAHDTLARVERWDRSSEALDHFQDNLRKLSRYQLEPDQCECVYEHECE